MIGDSINFATQKNVALVDGPMNGGSISLLQYPPNGIIRLFRYNASDDVVEFANYHIRVVTDGGSPEFIADYSHG